MYLLDLTLPTLPENLALDEALLLDAEAGGPEVLRLWRWPAHAVVLGAGGRIADDVEEAACQADGVPIYRRSSGGGTVLLGAGCLLFTLVLRFDRDPALADLHASYRFILGRIARGLEPFVPPSPSGRGAGGEGAGRCLIPEAGQAPSPPTPLPGGEGRQAPSPPTPLPGGEGSKSGPITLEGSSDLALAGRKFSGNSQQRKRTHLMHHGTLLHAFDFEPVARYLKAPPRQPEYRRQRGHAEFLTNLPIAEETLAGIVAEAWQADKAMTIWPSESAAKLVAEKYGRDEWTRRR